MKRYLGYLDEAEITIISRDSVDNFEELANEVGSNTYNQMVNVIFCKLLEVSIAAGWNKSSDELGNFIKKETKDIKFSSENPFADPEMVEMLNEYGRAALKSDSFPLLVLKDKETGKILDLPLEKTRSFFDDPMVRYFIYNFDQF